MVPARVPAPTSASSSADCQGASDAEAQPSELAYLAMARMFEPKNKLPTHSIVLEPGSYAVATLNKAPFVPARLPSNAPTLRFTSHPGLQQIVDHDAVNLAHGTRHLTLDITYEAGSSIAQVWIGTAICLPSDSTLMLMCCCTTRLTFERTCAGWQLVDKPISVCA